MATPDRLAEAWLRAERAPRRTFLADRLGELGYGRACARVRRMAGLFRRWGLRPGDRVLLASREDRSTAVLFLALLRCGLTAVLLDPDTGPDRARRLIALSGPEACLVERGLIEAWGLAGRERVLALVPEAAGGFLDRLRERPGTDPDAYPGCLAGLAPETLPEHLDPQADAYVMFTSGTLSDPKGVRITHRGLWDHLGTLGRVYGLQADSVLFNNLILSHADGINQGPLLAFLHGVPVVRPFPFQLQTMEAMLDAVYRHRVSHLIAVPTMLALLERHCTGRRDALRTRDFRLVVSCGGPLEEDLWRRFEATFGVPVLNLYGLTETVNGGLFAGPEAATRRPGTVGRPVDCEARIVAQDGRICAAGEPGEIQLRGSLVMAGYLNAPEATARALGAEGWLRTGDLGLREADGCYRVLGRIKALIIRGGFNVHPEEVSEALLAHPGVLEAVTFGLPDPVWGEQVASAVVAPGLDEASLAAFARTRLEGQKVPSRILFLDTLPRGRSGKVILEAVRAQAEAALRQASPGERGGATLEAAVLAEAARCFRVPVAILDLGSSPRSRPEWDSMTHLELVAGLEARFGIALSPGDILGLETLGDAVRIAAERGAAP